MHTATIQTSTESAARRDIDINTSAASATMPALVASGYGSPSVLALAERARPVPGDDDIVVRVHATTVTAADSMMRRGDPAYARLFLGLTRPKAEIPGTGFAGVVEAVGSRVTRFAPGEAVFGESGVGFGAHAQFVRVPESGVVLRKPESLGFDEAATMTDGALTSFNFLRRIADVQPGQHVLVNGASGSLGTAAVQLAKALGAEVTGVASAANLELVASLGADHVIDYGAEDFTRHRDRYDVIFDTVGKSSYRQSRKALTRSGVYMSPVLGVPLLFTMLWTRVFARRKARFDATGLRAADELRTMLGQLLELVEAGSLRTVIERVYPFTDIIDAHAHVDTGRKKGSVVVRMPDIGA